MLGELAIDLAVEHVPDLVLLDLHLPDMGGEEVARRLRAHPVTAAIPIVILTADATAHGREVVVATGATALTKPIAVADLLAVVDRYLAG
jgi:CheY-like chemotaxis protein